MSMNGIGGHDTGLNGAVAAVLRDEKAVTGLTMDRLAERSGIPTVTVQRLLTTKRVINMATLDQLCRGLSISPASVMVLAMGRIGMADPELVARVLAGMNGRAASPEQDVVTSST